MNIFYGGISKELQRKLKAELRQYMEDANIFWRAGITNIEFKSDRKTILIIVTLERPGYLIGPKGDTVTKLVKHLHHIGDGRLIKISAQLSKLWC